MTEYFAIKHMPSGMFLPLHCSGYGHTKAELCPTSQTPPRLFVKKQYAKSALTYWLKGEMHLRHYQDMEGEWDVSDTIKLRPDRKAHEMKVVPVKLVEIKETK